MQLVYRILWLVS